MNCSAGSVGTEEHLRSCVVLGTRLVYYDRGSGTPLVLVHGMFGDHLDWSAVLESLAEQYRVIAIDLPGFGGSDKSADRYTADFFVEALESFFGTLDLHEAVLVGHSFGGLISALYAASHPERLRALALVSSAGMKEYSSAERALVEEHFSENNLLGLRPEYVELLFAMNFAQFTEARAAYLERQRNKLSCPDYKVYAHVLAECMAMAFEHPIVPVLINAKFPVLLLWGDRDVVFPLELAQAALEVLPQARLEIVSGAGHMLQMDQPEEFVRLLARFIPTCKADKGK
jgi:pimeloyl-ACP methyl ester carboxylesterase